MIDDDEGRERVHRKREDEALQRIVEVAQLKELLEHEAVRDVMWKILGHCKVFAQTWSANYGQASFEEGKRSIGLWLLTQIIEASPEAYQAMQLKSARAQSEAARQTREEAARKTKRS